MGPDSQVLEWLVASETTVKEAQGESKNLSFRYCHSATFSDLKYIKENNNSGSLWIASPFYKTINVHGEIKN